MDFTTRRFRLAFFTGQCALLAALPIYSVREGLKDGQYTGAAIIAVMSAVLIIKYKQNLLLSPLDWLKAARDFLGLVVVLIMMLYVPKLLGTTSWILAALLVLVLTLTALAVLIDKQIRRFEQGQTQSSLAS